MAQCPSSSKPHDGAVLRDSIGAGYRVRPVSALQQKHVPAPLHSKLAPTARV